MKKTIGKNPLAEYLASNQTPPLQESSKQEESFCGDQPKITQTVISIRETKTNLKQRVTIHIPTALIERIKNAVYWEPGLTVAGFCEEALSTAIDQLESSRGSMYPTRKKQLKGGRPLK